MQQIIGELREDLSKDLVDSIEKVINVKQALEVPYYILVFSKVMGMQVLTKLMIMLEAPPKMLGTLCYYVDNKKGELVRLWALPLDIPNPMDELGSHACEEIFESAKDTPILH